MAFKNVTTGLTTINDVIDEIVTFATVDLPAPWTLEYNINPTAADVSSFSAVPGTGRNTCLSIAPAQPNTETAFHDSKIPNLPSPLPSRIYVKFRGVTEPGVQMCPSGYAPSGFMSPEAFLDSTTTGPQRWFDARPMNLNRTATLLPVVETNGNSGPFTQMWLFGPNQTSPISATIPNYVHFVIETEPGRFTHGFFGEMKKFVPFSGGWGAHGHDRNASDDVVSNSTNYTMWNQNTNAAGAGKSLMASETNQVPVNQSSANLDSPEPATKWSNRNYRGNTGWNASISASAYRNATVWGHTSYYRFMDETGISKISGFVPLGSPISFRLDEQVAGQIADRDGPIMPMAYAPDMWLGPISTFNAGEQISLGGVTVIPFPITSKLGTSPRSTIGGYFYRVLT